jgi:uncharacterized lipoprotein NlpE involved in copper resistance
MKTAFLIVCVALLAGCASQSSRDEAMTVAARFLDAASRSDTGAACALLTPRTRDDLVISEGQPCGQALPVDRLNGTVETADTWSDQAVVNTDGGSLFLTEFDAGWLVSSAGCEPDQDAPYHCVIGG